MKKLLRYLTLSGLLFGLFACNNEDITGNDMPAQPIDLTFQQSEKAKIDNRFSFQMFKEVSVLGDNMFFSPLSLNIALGMLYNGASGDTRTEMAEVLGMADFTDAEINAYYQKMSQALLKVDPKTQISIANSIWYRNTLTVKQPFIDVNKKYFDAQVQALDFSKSDAADIINKWCADKTKNLIKEIIAKPIPCDIVMYLMNALYFKGQWKNQFDKANTKSEDFTKVDNQKKKVNLMTQTKTMPYYVDEYLQCVEIPYGNQAFSMVALLPANDTNLNQLIDYLDNDKWQNIVNNLRYQEVQLKLPRFKIECSIELNEPVQNAGMKQIFEGGFANISDRDLCVSYIKQKTFVKVNEEGTEAAAVTVIGMKDAAGPSMPVSFFANRPFLYLIKEKSTGVILFIGRMDDPVE